MNQLKEILEKVTGQVSLEEKLFFLNNNVKEKIVFSTSFGFEDQVISHVILSQKLDNIKIFTLDTGRVFQETYNTWNKTEFKYQAKIKPFYPPREELENFVEENGINPFYDSVDLRKQCCYIRKVIPLNRALKEASVWITGLRAEQSNNRHDMHEIEFDEEKQLFKFNPLIDFTTGDCFEYLKENRVPYNPLHDKGFISIGCAPCTRAINEGEDFRAGRWWWEDNSKKECGLHAK
ncbi:MULTISPECIES: phosphoadenylyl-sulfate reductase [unclassified Empedobacter]|uniref:phosphoadenylyl-sulfate reductase n=1 Tax=unclassified Empedobacter TaxID=2643773 RepID=UPI0025C6B2F6|nr:MULTISPECIES: phosphoadenylyl-sulfate reductase [unclassified Empedobacter]